MPVTLSNLRDLGSFATLYKWRLDIVDFPKGFDPGISADKLDLLCYSSSVPKKTNQPIEVNIRGHKIKDIGITNYDNQITLTFVETDKNREIAKFLQAWSNAIWEFDTGKQMDRSDLIATIVLYLRSRDDTDKEKYTLYGCWLEDFDPVGGELSGDANDVVKRQFTISYDDYKWEIL